jgi:hypothetical protein
MLTAAPAKAKHDWTRIDENFQQGDYSGKSLWITP